MKSIVITPKDITELQFLSKLLKRLKISTRVLTEEEREDLGLSVLMKEADRTRKVSRNTIMKKLQK